MRDRPLAPSASSSRLAAAVEADLVAHVALLKGPPIGEVHRDPDRVWFVTGGRSPRDNGVLRARLPERGAEDAIERILAPFRARSLPMMWWRFVPTFERDDPTDRALRAHGLTLDSDLPGMGLDLATFRAPEPPAGASLHRVRDPAMLSIWADVVGRAFEAPDYASGPSVAGFIAHGFGADAPFRHYLGRLDGAWVGTSTLSLGAGVAGLANITSLPGVRGRGIGTAVAAAALADARGLGVAASVLSAGPLGVRLYERLGFRTVCRHLTYIWRP